MSNRTNVKADDGADVIATAIEAAAEAQRAALIEAAEVIAAALDRLAAAVRRTAE